MNTHLTGVCINCGKYKEEHFELDQIEPDDCIFHDSGQKALDDNAAELFEAVSEFKKWDDAFRPGDSNIDRIDAKRRMFSVLNKIEKEK